MSQAPQAGPVEKNCAMWRIFRNISQIVPFCGKIVQVSAKIGAFNLAKILATNIVCGEKMTDMRYDYY